MSVLRVGGEDVDFLNGLPALITTAAGTCRSGFARCAFLFHTQAGIIKGIPFAAATSCWLRFKFVNSDSRGTAGSRAGIGLGNSTTGDGLYFGFNMNAAGANVE